MKIFSLPSEARANTPKDRTVQRSPTQLRKRRSGKGKRLVEGYVRSRGLRIPGPQLLACHVLFLVIAVGSWQEGTGQEENGTKTGAKSLKHLRIAY